MKVQINIIVSLQYNNQNKRWNDNLQHERKTSQGQILGSVVFFLQESLQLQKTLQDQLIKHLEKPTKAKFAH